jgi:hypothetical protein
MLLGHGINVEVADGDGFTPLMWAPQNEGRWFWKAVHILKLFP